MYSPFNIVSNTVVAKAASAPLVAPGAEYLPPNLVVPNTSAAAGALPAAASNVTSPPPGIQLMRPPPGPMTHAHAAYHNHAKGERLCEPWG